MLPVMLTSDFAIQAVAIGIEGVALVISVDVARECVAQHAAQNDGQAKRGLRGWRRSWGQSARP